MDDQSQAPVSADDSLQNNAVPGAVPPANDDALMANPTPVVPAAPAADDVATSPVEEPLLETPAPVAPVESVSMSEVPADEDDATDSVVAPPRPVEETLPDSAEEMPDKADVAPVAPAPAPAPAPMPEAPAEPVVPAASTDQSAPVVSPAPEDPAE
ncbi:MAG: hypothetical protein NTW79_04515 [Candidatus Berkelbacteria bacterium]|nr:hypothetical protein [Candidatus Berkelbacteria bacterium]